MEVVTKKIFVFLLCIINNTYDPSPEAVFSNPPPTVEADPEATLTRPPEMVLESVKDDDIGLNRGIGVWW